jgi:hypothetical protein
LTLRGAGTGIGVAAGEEKFDSKARDRTAADLCHDDIDLVAQDGNRPTCAGKSAGGPTIERRPPDEAELCAEAQRGHDIGAAPDAAVQHQSRFVADRCVYLESVAALHSPETRKKFKAAAFETDPLAGDEFEKLVGVEYKLWKELAASEHIVIDE